ncbi:MAG TPA: fumarylacetoacetate hydrolase family protein [Anaerolineae bacterium]
MSGQTNFVDHLADGFMATESKHQPVERVVDHYPELTGEDAYVVQRAVVERLRQAGGHQVGYKIAATGKAVQEALGLAEPAYGRLFQSHQVTDGGQMPMAQLIKPVVECEIAFLLKHDLTGPHVSTEDVLAATESVVAAFEIVDMRTRGRPVSMLELIAYNALACGFVLGTQPIAPRGLDLPRIPVVCQQNGTPVASGTGAASMDHPATAVAWLANKLAGHDSRLRGGDIILSGTLNVPIPAHAGDHFEAVFQGLGSVSVSFN